jgi:hypothetical protein
MNGIYIGYFTGTLGNSMGVFYVGNGVIAGADIGSIRYDGTFSPTADGKTLQGKVKFTIPAGVVLISGLSGGGEPATIELPLSLPIDFASGAIARIQTPAGPVNARFEKVRDLPI